MKIDLIKDSKALYGPSVKEVAIVEVPPMDFLMVDGAGDPNTATAYKQAVEALYGLAYALKFMVKKGGGTDYRVMPLEGLWWADDMALFSADNKRIWKWTAMIRQPEYVDAELVARGIEQVGAKKDLPALDLIRYETFHEGASAQIMHIGPYADEAPTILKLHDFIRAGGFELTGKHHEIYLSDPRRSAPDKLKTVIRQPMKRPAP
jgi:hypothetical protein